MFKKLFVFTMITLSMGVSANQSLVNKCVQKNTAFTGVKTALASQVFDGKDSFRVAPIIYKVKSYKKNEGVLSNQVLVLESRTRNLILSEYKAQKSKVKKGMEKEAAAFFGSIIPPYNEKEGRLYRFTDVMEIVEPEQQSKVVGHKIQVHTTVEKSMSIFSNHDMALDYNVVKCPSIFSKEV